MNIVKSIQYEDSEKRTYNTASREAQAAQTRLRILEAAKQLFQTEGFDRVTISRLAQNAAVSMPTIYALFKSKRGVLQALIDEALPSKQFWSLVEDSNREKSPSMRLHIAAKIARQLYDAEQELMDLVRQAGVVAPEFKELEQERENRRYTRQADTVKTLFQENALAKGLSLTQARDLLWTLTGRDLYRMLVIERGWTSSAYEKWLAELLVHTLLKG